MATSGAEAAARAREDPKRPAFLELFFDLVFVFALISLAEKLVSQLTWTGAGQTLVLLLAFTLIWALTAWGAGHTFDLSQPLVQPQVIGVMAGSLLLAATVPEAYGSRGLLFAITYMVIHLGSSVYIWAIGRHGPLGIRSRRIFYWDAIAAVAWISGGLFADTARGVLWAVAVGVQYAAATLGWPAPRVGRSRSPEWRLVGERISERYRQFVIIAFGVSIFVTAKTFSADDYTLDRAWALVVVFMITVLMWRIYIYRAGELMTTAIARSTDPSRLSQFAAVTHLIMVVGIVGTAVTSQLVVDRPFGDTPPSWGAVILGGPALFLLGRGLLDYTVFGRVSRSRPAGIILLGALAPATRLLPPIMVALLVMIILALIAMENVFTTRTRPLAPAPPTLG
jgi:low temperature requirement protein LtrA